MSRREFSIEVLQGAAHVAATEWDRLALSADPDGNPAVTHAFFDALERSGCATPRTGWLPRHLLLREGQRIAGLMPLYEKTHSQGEYVFDHGWANAFEQAGGAYYPKLQSAVPFTPVTGPRLFAADMEARQALLVGARQLAEANGLSSVHATFIQEEEARLAELAGWLLRNDTQYHWRNAGFATFEQYLGTLSSRHRKAMRRERREAAEGLAFRWLTGADLTEAVWDAFFVFYEDTGSRKWGQPYLNRKFFSLLSEVMADRVVVMMAYDAGTPIAGTMSLLGRKRLYGRYWGTTRNVPFLHFELCYYQAIDFAIAHGLEVVEAGAQGEHKLARGYAPATTWSAHWIAHEGLRTAVARYLQQERRAVAREQQALADLTPFRKG